MRPHLFYRHPIGHVLSCAQEAENSDSLGLKAGPRKVIVGDACPGLDLYSAEEREDISPISRRRGGSKGAFRKGAELEIHHSRHVEP